MQIIDLPAEGACTVLPLRVACPLAPSQRALGTRQFAEIGPQHHGPLWFEAKVRTPIAALGEPTATQAFELAQPSRMRQLADGLNDGIQLAQGRKRPDPANGLRRARMFQRRRAPPDLPLRVRPPEGDEQTSGGRAFARESVGRGERPLQSGRSGPFFTDPLS
ncbi:MAG TPA: hypothetical protein VET87_06545 [Rubrivivax sp.]|nr:hypothetical protein [Rubrivivax sp.]